MSFSLQKNPKSRNAQLEFFSKYGQKPPQIFGRKFANLKIYFSEVFFSDLTLCIIWLCRVFVKFFCSLFSFFVKFYWFERLWANIFFNFSKTRTRRSYVTKNKGISGRSVRTVPMYGFGTLFWTLRGLSNEPMFAPKKVRILDYFRCYKKLNLHPP